MMLTTRGAALTAATDALDKATSALCERTNQERLDLARTAWRGALVAWRGYEPLVLDPAAQRAIDSGTPNTPAIEAAVRQFAGDPAQAGTRAADYGLPALEYLFWGDARAKAQLGRLAFKQRCAYARSLATDTAHAAAGLVDDTSRAVADAAPLAYLDNLVRLLDAINATRLGSTTAPSYSDAAVAVDAWRSELGKVSLGTTLDATRTLLLGPDNSGSPLLQQAGAAWLATGPQGIKATLDQLAALLDALPGDLADAFRRNPKTARQIRDAVLSLRTQVAALRQAVAEQGSHRN